MDELVEVTEVELERETELEQIEAWRLKRFLEMELPLEDAENAALSSIDLHEFEHLIASGCPPTLAYRTLR